MKNRFIRKHPPVTLVFVSSLIMNHTVIAPASADWSSEKLYKGYNQPYGSFPPVDIDQQLSDSSNTNTPLTEKPTQAPSPQITNRTNSPGTRQLDSKQLQNTQQNYQHPSQGTYPQGVHNQNAYNHNSQYYPQQSQRYNRNTGSFSGPWNNRNSRSGFNGPWNNNRSNFSGPWNNNRSSFSGPWNNNSSGFSMPWGNNGSGFNPMGNGGGWSW